MTQHHDHDDAGAYVLGALSDAETDAFTTHLHDCEQCREDVARLQMAVDTLPLSVAQMTPPPALKSRIMAVVEAEAELLRAAGPEADRVPSARDRRERPRWLSRVFERPAMAAGLASLLLVLGVGGGLLAGGGGDAPVRSRTVEAKVQGTGTAVLVVQGSRAKLRVAGLPSPPKGKVYQVWYQRSDKGPEPTHTLFSVRKGDGRAEVDMQEPIDGVQTILVTAEDDGGSTVPTSFPVIRARAA